MQDFQDKYLQIMRDQILDWLAYVLDTLMEGMSVKKFKTFIPRLLEAKNIDADLNKIKTPFLIYLLEFTLDKIDHHKHPGLLKVVNNVINLFKSGETDLDEFKRVAWAARDDGSEPGIVWFASMSVINVPNAEYAAIVMDTAANWAARVANSKTNAYNQFADKLIELIKECK